MTLADERVEDESRRAFRIFVTSGYGVTALDVAGDRVDGYALVHDCTGLDVAAAGDNVAVATSTDVLLGDEDGFEPTGFGPAVAVGGDPLVAAGPDGKIARLRSDWEPIGRVDSDVAAIDGDLLATADGVFRLVDDEIDHVGLENATDVATAGTPHAATTDGLYKLGAGWMPVQDGSFSLVATDARTAAPGTLRRAHAATADRLFVFDGEEWQPWHIPVDAPIAGIDYGEMVYAVSVDGTFLAVEDDAWRTRALGLSDVTGLVVLEPGEENA